MKQKTFYYKSGLPFSSLLALELDDINLRVKENKASMVIIDGQIGTGKTTLGVHCADYLNGAYVREEEFYSFDESKSVDLEIGVALGGSDFTKKLKLSFDKKQAVLIYDEAGDFNSRGALTKFNALLNRVFETFRAFKVVVIMCLPFFASLDGSLLIKGIPRLLVHIDNRNMQYGNYRIYSLWHMFYILHKMKKLIVKTDAFRFTDPCSFGHFLDLPKARAKKLDVISTKNKLDVLGDVEVKIEGFYTYADLSKRLGRSVSWISKTINLMKLPCKRIHRNKKYFDEAILDLLSQEVEKINIKQNLIPD